VLKGLGQLASALASYDRGLAIQPESAAAHSNRGALLTELHEWNVALASCDLAIAIAPGYADAHFNRSLCLLLTGDWLRGWAGFEWRLQSSQAKKAGETPRAFAAKRWDGQEPLAGKAILLHGEQGLGDTIQFVRYAKLVADLGTKVVLEVQPPLIGLLSGLDGISHLAAQGDSLPPYDLHCPLMSLPFAFGTTPATVPALIPYLKAPSKKVDEWSNRLGEKTKPRVGIVWSGGFRPNHPEQWLVNGRRNIPLRMLTAWRHPGVEFYSLQKGEPAESELAQCIASHWDGPGVHDVASHLKDFTDTAALIENLDLTVTVDTSVAHLAAALGKPVWMLNRFDSCWRWLLDRSDSPWYPTMRLYRQEGPGDWEGVVKRVKTDLDTLADSQPRQP
jgi:tetratricopeptide (TPR) repeat protein